jgi:hypothetical protein
MVRTQALNQQKKAVAALSTPAATSTAPAAAAALRTSSSAKRSPVKTKVVSERAHKKAKVPSAPATDRVRSPEKEIDAGKEIATGSGITAETNLFPETDINLAEFLMETDFAEKKDATADITPGTDIPSEKEGSSCSLAGIKYNLRTRPEKQPHLDDSDTDAEDEEKDESDEDSADDVPKKPDATPTKIHQNVARLKGSGSRGRPIVPVSPSGTIELSL